MTASWTLTEGAIWDWTYSASEGDGNLFEDNTVVGNSSEAFTSIVSDTGAGTYLTVLSDQASDTGTFYTSTIVTTQTTIRTTTATLDDTYYETSQTFAWDSGQSSIGSGVASASATRTTQITTASSVLSTTSAGTYLQPLGLPDWLDVNAGDGAYAPTVYAWVSNAGYAEPSATNATSLPSAVTLAHSGAVTVYPYSEMFEIPQAPSVLPDITGVFTTWQSDALTWTEQAQTQTTLTRAVGAGSAPITRSTQTYITQIDTTQSSSSVFSDTSNYADRGLGETKSWVDWWQSTTLTARTYRIANQTSSGQSTTTTLASRAAFRFINLLESNQSGRQPLAPFELSESRLRGQLAYGNYSQFFTANSGHALNTSQAPGAAISAAASFVLPAQSFSTALLQRGNIAPLPFQTRSRTSSNSTTLWSVGASAVSMTTYSSDTSTQGSTTSSYALSIANPTLYSTSYVNLESTNYTAAGGAYPTSSLFVGHGLFTATDGTSKYTSSGAISAGTGVTAIQPLPHFVPQVGFPSIQTQSAALQTQQKGFFGITTIAFPLTA